MTDDAYRQLLRAAALGELTADERRQLVELATAIPEHAAALRSLDAITHACADERALSTAVAAPVEPMEEADATFQRLQRAAARAEAGLRAQLLHPVPARAPVFVPAPWRRRLVIAVLAVAAAVAVVLLLQNRAPSGPRAPGLNHDNPADKRVGASLQLILLQPALAADARTLLWAAVTGADGYDATILDAAGLVVLQRDASQRRSTAWEPTTDQFATLRARAPLHLRVTALDGAGIPIGSSGDLPLTLR